MRRLLSCRFSESARNSSSNTEWPFTKYNLRPSDLVVPVTSMRWISRSQMMRWMSAGISFNKRFSKNRLSLSGR